MQVGYVSSNQVPDARRREARGLPPRIARYIFFAASFNFLPLCFTLPLIWSRRPSASRSRLPVTLPAVSFTLPPVASPPVGRHHDEPELDRPHLARRRHPA